jgi:hypothetical protein
MAALDTDLRRSDQRTNVRVNPFWITSAEINKDVTNEQVALFAFPEALGNFYLHQFVFEVETLFAGGTPSIDIGYCTLDDPATNLDYSGLDYDEYIPTACITEVTAAYYMPTSGDWYTAWAAGTVAVMTIVGADTAMPCILAKVATGLTSGAGRLHVMVSKLP